jgi:hypothetical protein
MRRSQNFRNSESTGGGRGVGAALPRQKTLKPSLKSRRFLVKRISFTSVKHRAGFMEESAMLAGERGLKLMDAMHWHAAVNNRCDFLLPMIWASSRRAR